MRVAALYDVHGNVAALDAVLAQLEHERADAVLFGGDVATGPFPRETLDRLMALDEAVYFVRGNADRELVAAYDARLPFDPKDENPARRFSAWAAPLITKAQRDFLSRFEERVVLRIDGLGETLFCHGSPRSDVEMITALTPERDLRRMLMGVEQQTVVCGHTHMQFDRVVDDVRVVNAGSVGMPYEARPGAFWALLGPDVQLCRTDYDFDRAVAQLRASGFPDRLIGEAEIILAPPCPTEIAEQFERLAEERGERA